jgi:tetratricopeptide (TPR) repeat protein
MRGSHVVLVFLCVSALAPEVVRAEPVTAPAAGPEREPGARERAKVFFERGITEYRDARYSEALKSFGAALETYDSPVFIYNLARTCDRLGDVSCALRHYRTYQRRAPRAKDLTEVVPRIQALEAALASRGVQQITVLSKPSGAQLDVDGQPLGKTPWTGELSPGAHSAKLTMAGHEELRVNIDVAAAAASEVTLVMSPRTEAPTPVAPLTTTTPAAQRPPEAAQGRSVGPWTYVTLSVAVAALGGALIFEQRSRDREQDVRTFVVQRDRVAAYDDMHNFQTTARVLAGVGVGLAAVGATLLVLDLRQPTAPGAQVSLWMDPRSGGVAWKGRW